MLHRAWLPVLLSALLTAQASLASETAPQIPEEEYTLERCLLLALECSASMDESRELVVAAGERVGAASAARLPRLDAGAHYRYASEVMEHRIEMPGLGGIDLRFGDGHQTDINLGISFPLYTGGRVGRIQEAEEAGLLAARFREAATARELFRDVRRAYFEVLGREAQLEVVNLGIRRLERRLESLRGARVQESATEEDVLRVRSRLLEAEQSRHRAEAGLEASSLQLGRLIGQVEKAIRPLGDLKISLMADLDSEDLAPSQALQRPELLALGEDIHRQSKLAESAASALRPSLYGDLRGHYGRPGVDLLENEWMGYATAGLTLNWTLWDGGAGKHERGQFSAQARRLEARREETTRAIRTARASASALLESSRRELENSNERVRVEAAILEKVSHRLQLAQASENELLDAQDDLNKAEQDRVLALIQLRKAEAELLWTLGL